MLGVLTTWITTLLIFQPCSVDVDYHTIMIYENVTQRGGHVVKVLDHEKLSRQGAIHEFLGLLQLALIAILVVLRTVLRTAIQHSI